MRELDRELRAAGIPRARRHRIVAELQHHLACDPEAQLGDPHALARQFADELGTVYARRAGFVSFLALVPFGLAFGALFAVDQIANVAVVLGTQLAFVGGTLATLRAWRVRRALVVPGAQATVLLRRSALATVGAALTAGGLLQSSAPVAAIGFASVAVSAVALARGVRLRPIAHGAASGDLATDLGRTESPLRLALLIAGAVALCIAAAGVVQDDPFDGLLRAALDDLLCLGGYAALGRYLGLRASRDRAAGSRPGWSRA